jgi:ketosteroid isomerase-like protein
MSREHIEIVRERYEAFSEGDLTALLEGLDPNIVSYTAPPLPDPAEYHGHEGFLQWISNWTEGFDDFEMEVEDYTQAGEHVVARVYQRATGAGSGAPTERRFWLLHAVREGKVVRIGIYGSEAEVLDAAGHRAAGTADGGEEQRREREPRRQR